MQLWTLLPFTKSFVNYRSITQVHPLHNIRVYVTSNIRVNGKFPLRAWCTQVSLVITLTYKRFQSILCLHICWGEETNTCWESLILSLCACPECAKWIFTEIDEAQVDLSLSGIWSSVIRQCPEILFLGLEWVFYYVICFKNIQDDDIGVILSESATFGRKIGTVMAFVSDFETDNLSAQR